MMHRHEFNAMGCKMLAISDSKQKPPDLEMVPQWFEEWERSLSRFRIDSELSQFNLHAGLPIKVSQTLWDVFTASVEAERMTGGLINPLILNALINAG